MTGREELNDLMTEFDELSYYMGYCPTTLCSEPEAEARDWKARLMCAVDKIEREARSGASDDGRLNNKEQQMADIAAAIITAYVLNGEGNEIEVAKEALYEVGYRKGEEKCI